MSRMLTIALPTCEPECPPRNEWPNVSLVRGLCPMCGRYEGSDGKKSARVLRARRLIEERALTKERK